MGNDSKKIPKKDNETKTDDTKNNTLINIEKYLQNSSKPLTEGNSYLAKKIEDEYAKIETNIQQICLGKNSDDEEKENEILGKYLFELKQISEKAFIFADKLKDSFFEEFKSKNKEFSNLRKHDDPGCILEFSAWCKNSLKDEKKFLEEMCDKYKDKEYNDEDLEILKQLTGIYLKCFLCSQKIEFKKCKNNCEFNPKEMYDMAEIRDNKRKKVNFYVLPGLYTNELFFRNGKIHVFTYLPDTYYLKLND